MIAIAARSGDAPGYDLRLEHQLRKLAKDIDVRREARFDADVLLVIIGLKWAEPPLDTRSVEAIARTHAAGRTIIPVLVQGGTMPGRKALPPTIQSFATIHAATLHNDEFEAGVAKLLERILGGDGGGPWRDGDASGRIRISSVNPGLLIRAVSVIDSVQPVTVRIDGAIHGSLHLFGDELTVPVAAGRHEVLLRNQWEDPVHVDVPANATMVLSVKRNVLSGAVKITGTKRE